METLRFEALGGQCELYSVEPAEPLGATVDWIGSLHRRLTRFDPASELSRLNARAGEWIDVSPVLHELLSEALAAYELSGGLVHAGVLPAVVAAGYDRTFDEIPLGTVPAANAEPVRPLPDLLGLRPRVARVGTGAAIDLGGLAKGWIAERAAMRLGTNALVSCSGDLMAIGPGPDGDGWPVGFAGRTLLLDGMAAATSGTRSRRWGDGLHHLIDPRTGRPSATDLSEASVLARSGVDAEILAKAAVLLGASAAPAFLEARALGWALS